ncbi:MAG: hypothetical protein IKE85_10185 [Mogibacterium sp.]|nr:hypothetical protein [Mogibacterium sp.]
MRVQMLMRDTEYRDAMIKSIASSERDIFLEIEGNASKDGNSVILTDIRPEEIDDEVLKKIAGRTLFLTGVRSTCKPQDKLTDPDHADIHTIFKYSCLSSIMSELTLIYHNWTGDPGGLASYSRTIAVTGESDLVNSDRCRELARQIIYRHGGSVLIIPLGYINDYAENAGEGKGWFKRLMYLIEEGRDFPSESFVYRDTYGISYLMLPPGLNPVSGLSGDYLAGLIRTMGARFDTVILDIGSCYRRENIEICTRADNILFVGSGRRIPNMEKIIGSEAVLRLESIRYSPDSDLTLEIDEYVRRLYEDKNDQERNSNQVLI